MIELLWNIEKHAPLSQFSEPFTVGEVTYNFNPFRPRPEPERISRQESRYRVLLAEGKKRGDSQPYKAPNTPDDYTQKGCALDGSHRQAVRKLA